MAAASPHRSHAHRADAENGRREWAQGTGAGIDPSTMDTERRSRHSQLGYDALRRRCDTVVPAFEAPPAGHELDQPRRGNTISNYGDGYILSVIVKARIS